MNTTSVLQHPPLIPREILFGNPQRAMPQISPDGTRLAYLAPLENVLNVWIRSIDKNDDHPITHETRRGIRQYFWAEDNRHLIYVQDKDGDENWHLYAVAVSSGEIIDITPHENIQAQPLHVDPNFPDEILIAMNIRDKRLHDVYRLNLKTKQEQLVTENPGDVSTWVVDHEFRVRGASAQTPDGGFVLRVRDDERSAWRELVRWPSDDGFPNIYGFTPDGKSLYIGDPRDWNSERLVEISADTGKVIKLADDPQYDIGNIIIHPTQHHAQAVSFYKDRNVWTVLDKNISPDIETIKNIDTGDFTLLNRSRDDNQWVLAFIKDNGPVPYYIYDRTTKSAAFLFTNRPALEEYILAPMKPITVAARDGLTLHGYLTLPAAGEEKNLPMVLNVHGGPWVRDTWGLNVEAQWFTNRGYACLQMNYRGSTGYGKKFLNAGNREWGAKMHDDLIDSVRWAITQGIADAKRIAIYGASYGGYAALAGAAFTPDVFTCAIDIVGPSNLITLIGSIPPYWEPLKKTFHLRVGNPETEEEFLKSRSPLFSAEKITIPMFIAQGANDPRVKQAESEQIVDALKKNGKDVRYMLFPDEGHGFNRPENRLKFYAAAEEFLAKYLGGRAEK